MPTLRRILKYTPAVVLGLLVVAWVVTLFGHFGYVIRLGQQAGYVGFFDRCLRLSVYSGQIDEGWFWYKWPRPPPGAPELDHSPYLPFETFEAEERAGWLLVIPITLLQTAVLTVIIGPIISFRFRLWHYLAYTALVAVELAYYLRWQE